MTIAWFDGGAGASGDMMLGALVGAGVPLTVLQTSLDPFDLGISLRVEDVQRGGLGATKVHVDVPETRTMRHLPEILALFESLDPSVRQSASAVFQRLAEAEASVHQTSIDEVHFHEVGALDSIADVVASCAGIQHLNLEAIYCSTLSLGNGNTRGAHGPIPVPVPAVLQIMKGVTAVQAGPAPFESTTPTGAALLAELVDVWGPMPPMTIDTIGMGAGTKDSTEVANVLRVVLGQPPLS
ncbi:MAG TPA: hypothetical protein DCY82_13125 [Acidimicrobiaceae bacterium]|nr:hypothetical protein [Acidimicrobiaceae bacterium]